ncbi:MAG TPA: hypothetical protein VIF62_14240 [Labilithrix sp.]
MNVRAKGRTRAALVATILAATLAFGCKKKDQAPAPADDDSQTLAQDGTDTSFVESDSELLTSSLVGTSTTSSVTLATENGADLSPEDVGDGAKTFFFPRGCLTVANDAVGKNAKYHFESCSGPLGLLHIKGDVAITYDVGPNKLVLDLVGSSLQVNRATVDYHAHAEIDASGVNRKMVWSAQLSGVTARGRDFTRTSTKTITWQVGGRCFTLDGTSEGQVKGRGVKTEITNYARCGAACPEAGGKITITNEQTGLEVGITFDGTANATFSAPSGSTSIPLICAG